jgi:carboxylesterase type B
MPPPRSDGLEMFGEPSGEPQGEDCLVLNVWTPEADDGRRPVSVYFHGGEFVQGSGAPAYDGAALAQQIAVAVSQICDDHYRRSPLRYPKLMFTRVFGCRTQLKHLGLCVGA